MNLGFDFTDLNEREALELFNNAHKRLLQIEALNRIQSLLDEIKKLSDENGIGYLALGLTDTDDPESVEMVWCDDFQHIMLIPDENHFVDFSEHPIF